MASYRSFPVWATFQLGLLQRPFNPFRCWLTMTASHTRNAPRPMARGSQTALPSTKVTDDSAKSQEPQVRHDAPDDPAGLVPPTRGRPRPSTGGTAKTSHARALTPYPVCSSMAPSTARKAKPLVQHKRQFYDWVSYIQTILLHASTNDITSSSAVQSLPRFTPLRYTTCLGL